MSKRGPGSANLRAELARASVTHQEVAEALGLHQPDVSWRMKIGRWRDGDLDKIAGLLGVDVEILSDTYQPPGVQRTATG